MLNELKNLEFIMWYKNLLLMKFKFQFLLHNFSHYLQTSSTTNNPKLIQVHYMNTLILNTILS